MAKYLSMTRILFCAISLLLTNNAFAEATNLSEFSTAEETCEWTVIILNLEEYGNDVLWELKDQNGDVLLFGGEYDEEGYHDYQTVTATGPVTFTISSLGDEDNHPIYLVHNGVDALALGVLDANTSKTYENLLCNDDPAKYCTPVLDCESDDTIRKVVFQEINNETGCSAYGYGDFTNLTATVEAGKTYPIEVTVGEGWHEVVTLWIDYGQDGSFDEEDFIGEIGGGKNTTITSEITIPEGTVNGAYRMRFSAYAAGENNPGNEDPCYIELFDFGEFEDYTLVVDNDDLAVKDLKPFSFNYFPNPVHDILSIQTNQKVTSIEVYNLAGQKVLHSSINKGLVDVSHLKSGSYLFKVTLNNDQIETFKIIKK